MKKKDPIIFIKHIKNSIEKIMSFVKNISKEEFLNDELRKSAVTRELEVIGEAVKNTPSTFLSLYQNINWKAIAGTRDKIIHHYFGVDYEIVWEIIEKDLPNLDTEIKKILKDNK